MKNDDYYEIAIKYRKYLEWNSSYKSTIENFVNFLYEYNYNYKIINNNKKIYKIIYNYLDKMS